MQYLMFIICEFLFNCVCRFRRQRVCCIAYILSKQSLEADTCLPFTQTTRRGEEILCIDIYKTIDNFTDSIKYLVYTPKCAARIVVFDFSWGDCIKRRKKLETMVMKNLVGGRLKRSTDIASS